MVDVRDFFQPPEWNDDEIAARWRGPVFFKRSSPVTWKVRDPVPPGPKWKALGVDDFWHYFDIACPKSVTFPICHMCGRLVWDWPHFEEEVPDNAVCNGCFAQAESDGDVVDD